MWHSITFAGVSLATSVLPKLGFLIEASHKISVNLVAVGLKCYRSSSVPNNLFSWVVLSFKSDWTEIFFPLGLRGHLSTLEEGTAFACPNIKGFTSLIGKSFSLLLLSLPHPIFALPRAVTCWFRLQPGSCQSRLLLLPGFLLCCSPQAEMHNLLSSCV